MHQKLHAAMLLVFVYLLQVCYVITVNVTKEEFNLTVTNNGYPVPEDTIYKIFSENTRNFSRADTAMFIAQLIHESGGFKFLEQSACLEDDYCKGSYIDSIGLPDKNYHGRGFIQLTWGANYKAASEGLGLGDRLLKNPEIIANDTEIAMLVSVWYWNTRVKPLLKGREHFFGLTTKGINPDECLRTNALAHRRYQIYLKVADALKIAKKANENGCYN